MSRKKVLFVCYANCIRSQMAEGFAKTYGADVLNPHSAGLVPTTVIAPFTRSVMLEKNIRLDEQFPKGLDAFGAERFDMIVNLSGETLTLRFVPAAPGAILIEWNVKDPMGSPEAHYRQTAAAIEGLVMRLILDLRNKQTKAAQNTAKR